MLQDQHSLEYWCALLLLPFSMPHMDTLHMMRGYNCNCLCTQITKEQVDRSQSFPHCCLSIEWTGVEAPVELEHVVDLIGAKGPSNYICIKRTPEGTCRANAWVIFMFNPRCVVSLLNTFTVLASGVSTPNQHHVCVPSPPWCNKLTSLILFITGLTVP